MPGCYVIDEARSLVLGRSWGAITIDEIVARSLALRRDPRYRADFKQLVDFTQGTSTDMSSTEIRRLADVSTFGAGSRRAICVSSAVAFGLSRMFEAMRRARTNAPEEIRIFRDVDEGIAWLGLTAERDALIALLDAAQRDVIKALASAP